MRRNASHTLRETVLPLSLLAGDTLVTFAGLALGWWLRYAPSSPVSRLGLDVPDATFARYLPLLLVLAIVQGVLLTLRGQSIGKLLCRIRIVRMDTEGRPGFVRAFLLRGTVPLLIEQVPLLGGLFWIVDACFIFGDERRCVHDYIAGTKVVAA